MYLVGRICTEVFEWDFQGVFSSREKAIAACRDSSYFFYPVSLDEEIPHESMEAPNIEWPKKC